MVMGGNKRTKIIKVMRKIHLKKGNGKITENNNEVLEVMKKLFKIKFLPKKRRNRQRNY